MRLEETKNGRSLVHRCLVFVQIIPAFFKSRPINNSELKLLQSSFNPLWVNINLLSEVYRIYRSWLAWETTFDYYLIRNCAIYTILLNKYNQATTNDSLSKKYFSWNKKKLIIIYYTYYKYWEHISLGRKRFLGWWKSIYQICLKIGINARNYMSNILCYPNFSGFFYYYF
jgi:hypothetical protein